MSTPTDPWASAPTPPAAPRPLDAPGAVLFNHDTGQQEFVPAANLSAALESGRYQGGAQLLAAPGGTIPRRPEDIAGALATGEHVDPLAEAARADEAFTAKRRASFDNIGDKAFTLAEGAVDAFTLGLLHEHGDAADIRRGVNAGSALIGQIGGLVAGLGLPGAVSTVAKGGEAIGAAAVKASGIGSKVLTRAIKEAGVNASLMAAGSAGHQLSDAIFENKDFSAGAIVHEATLGGLLGFGAGVLSGTFSKIASRGKVAAQGGLIGDGKAAVEHFESARSALHDSVNKHAANLGAVEKLAGMGEDDAIQFLDLQGGGAKEALKEARAAAGDLAKYDAAKAWESGPKDWHKFRLANDRYHKAAAELDVAMRPGANVRAPRGGGDVQPGPAFGSPEKTGIRPQGGEDARQLDRLMAADPELRIKYQDIYGEPYMSMGDQIMDGPIPESAVAGAESSGPKTLAGKRGARVAEPVEPVPVRTASGVPEGPAGEAFAERGVIADAARGPGPFTEVGFEGGPGPARPFELPKRGSAGPGDYSPFRPEGYVPPVGAAENAANFARFRDKMAEDTLAGGRGPAAAPAPLTPTVELPRVAEVPVGSTEKTIPGARGSRNPTVGTPAQGPVEAAPLSGPPTRPMGPKEPGGRAHAAAMAAENKAAIRAQVDAWYREVEKTGPRVSPGDEAAARIKEIVSGLRDASQGRIDSSAALGLAEHLGVPPSDIPLGDAMDQVWAIKQAGKFAADEARGVATPLRHKSFAMRWLGSRVAGRAGANVAGAVLGHAVGGPLGFMAGVMLMNKMTGMAGGIASAAGHMYARTAQVGEALLRGSRATVAVRAVAGNRPYAYSSEGPIKDPVKRIQEIHRMAGNEEAVRATVKKQLGDLVVVHPEVAQKTEDAAVRQLKSLSISAPAIYFSAVGDALVPSMSKMRQFHEYENATHNPDDLLDSVANGSVTEIQAKALREQHPEIHSYLLETLLADPEALKRASTTTLRMIERVSGAPLTTRGADPSFALRMQSGWSTDKTPPQKPQAFKITAPKPLPGQAASSGRAPGNQ